MTWIQKVDVHVPKNQLKEINGGAEGKVLPCLLLINRKFWCIEENVDTPPVPLKEGITVAGTRPSLPDSTLAVAANGKRSKTERGSVVTNWTHPVKGRRSRPSFQDAASRS
jgi:hypothetical protein